MDTILYLYPVRQTVEQRAQAAVCKSQPVQKGNAPRGKLETTLNVWSDSNVATLVNHDLYGDSPQKEQAQV